MMKIKRIVSLLLAFLVSTTPVMAQKSEEFLYMDIMLNYAANLYIDDSANSVDLLYTAVEEAVKELEQTTEAATIQESC